MVRHNNEFIQLGTGKMAGNFAPTFLHNFTALIQSHCTINNCTEQTFAVFCANRDKIRPGL